MTTDESDYKRRKLLKDPLRTISTFSVSPPHPLNVKPGGNALLVGQKFAEEKKSQLGYLSSWPDELILEFFSYITDIPTLLSLSHTSRLLYAYTYDEELWKKTYISTHISSEPAEWLGSWRSTTLQIKFPANIQLPSNLLCSDILYRPFQCSQINYEKLFKKIIAEETQYHLEGSTSELLPGRIPRIKEDDMTNSMFESVYHNIPFILTNSSPSRWPKWTINSLLERFSDIKFRQESMEWSLKMYSNYLAENVDESPLYLFDCASEAMKVLKNEYDPPKIFKDDLFTVFSSSEFGDCRPDHAWLILGPERSGSTFHKDPNYTSAWNTALTGRKLWIMFPPGIAPPGVGTDDDESEVTAPVGVAEWVLSGFFNDCLKIPECQIAITFPGECMYVPSTWWHSVINIDDSVALTQNFVPTSKLTNSLNFLKNKTNQLSGFRPNQVKAVLNKFLASPISNDESIEKIKEYQQKINELDLDSNEDCGELSELPPMPIFDFFKQLLIKNGKEQKLIQSLDELNKQESKLILKGNKWNELKKAEESTFSFGFEESDDE